jgi:hypothetical protein
MDYFQGVVTEYLRADRSVFVNTEMLIQLDLGDSPAKGRSWFCDVAASNFRDSTLYLCEITYSKTMSALAARLLSWSAHWPEVRQAILRDCAIPDNWQIKPWAFIPKAYHDALKNRIGTITNKQILADEMPAPLITYLEKVVPWQYKTWDRKLATLEEET